MAHNEHVYSVNKHCINRVGGSLDLVLNAGRIPVNIIGKISVAVSCTC